MKVGDKVVITNKKFISAMFLGPAERLDCVVTDIRDGRVHLETINGIPVGYFHPVHRYYTGFRDRYGDNLFTAGSRYKTRKIK